MKRILPAILSILCISVMFAAPTVSREDGDSDEGLRLRGERAVSEWLSGFSDTASAAVEVTAGTASTEICGVRR